MIDYSALLKDLRTQLNTASGITVDELYIAFGGSSRSIPAQFPPSIQSFYKKLSSFELAWKSNQFNDQLSLTGCAKILPVQEVDSDWKEVLWFDHTPADDPIRNFRILDFFVDEACVGFYEKGKGAPNLYFYDFEEQPVDLQVDMEGYIQLLCAARGFRYWPLVLVSFLEKKEITEAETFKTYMPQLFPDFSFDAFKTLFDKVRLHR